MEKRDNDLNIELTQMISTQGERKFIRQQEQYSLTEKKELGELFQRYKEEYYQELKKALGARLATIKEEKSMTK